MARFPISESDLVARYGPHLNEEPPGGWNAGIDVDREVHTHCCFCGQQCGIVLKVKGDEVVGFEPWYEFPFNQGKLCPKGVKRYLQNAHPDRLLSPLERDPSNSAGFRTVTWEEALARTVREINRIQAAYGKDAFAMLSGVSLDNEKSYLIGKFARLALGTANLDYNGRLCMVSAGVANKRALGIDRASNPWSDIPLAEVVLVIGANIAECAPITTSWIWRARDHGAKLIVADQPQQRERVRAPGRMVIEPHLRVVVLRRGGKAEAVAGDGSKHEIDQAPPPRDGEVEACDARVSFEQRAGIDEARLYVAVQLIARDAAFDIDDASGEIAMLHAEVAGEVIDRSDQV